MLLVSIPLVLDSRLSPIVFHALYFAVVRLRFDLYCALSVRNNFDFTPRLSHLRIPLSAGVVRHTTIRFSGAVHVFCVPTILATACCGVKGLFDRL